MMPYFDYMRIEKKEIGGFSDIILKRSLNEKGLF